MLFDEIERDFMGLHGHTEPLFNYLNRSSRPSMARIRELLENWYSNYPQESRHELRARFRSPDNIQHKGAFFELYLHALVSRLGYRIETHPTIPTISTKPEFLVYREEIPSFYLEATLAAGPSEETAADKRKNEVYETIDRVDSPNFFIGVNVEKSAIKAPPGRKWRGAIERWLPKLNPDEIGAKMKSAGLENLPTLIVEKEGWKVAFQAIPKSPQLRGKPGVRPIGMHFIPFHQCNEDEWIRNAIEEKATKYGNLNMPYLIAINVLSVFSNEPHMIMDALFGDEQVTAYFAPGGKTHDELTRASNGVLRGREGPRNTRVSGIVVLSDLSWGNIAKTNPVLWHNPWASRPLDSELWPFPQWTLNEPKTKIVPKTGRDAGDFFGMLKEWPLVEGEKDYEL
ncbi:MAG: hypothetical protein NTU60_10460 [Candidatus Aminicenantes bacterium]|nr:hypothetical protein [Candidatus Aminicenantes bacterium]